MIIVKYIYIIYKYIILAINFLTYNLCIVLDETTNIFDLVTLQLWN